MFNLSRDRTYIDRSLSYQLEFGATPISISHLLIMLVQFLGPHLYRLVIVLSVKVRGRTYIDRSSHCLVSLVSGTTPISIGHCFIS